MAVTLRRIAPLLVLAAFAGCTKTVYVRVPAVCPQDPYCLGAPNAADAATRRDAFDRRLAASTFEVRASRYVKNEGYRTTTSLGTRIGADGYVLAALHPIHGADRVTVTLPSSDGVVREVPMLPLVISIDKDVVLLAPPRDERMPLALPVRNGPVIAGDEVCVRGISQLRCGRVTAINVGEGPSPELADTDLRGSRTDVGAAVVNVCGEVVGMVAGTNGGMLRIVPLKTALTALNVTDADLR